MVPVAFSLLEDCSLPPNRSDPKPGSGHQTASSVPRTQDALLPLDPYSQSQPLPRSQLTAASPAQPPLRPLCIPAAPQQPSERLEAQSTQDTTLLKALILSTTPRIRDTGTQRYRLALPTSLPPLPKAGLSSLISSPGHPFMFLLLGMLFPQISCGGCSLRS